MDEKLPKIRHMCSICFAISRVLFYAAILSAGIITIYAVALMFLSESSFTATTISTGVYIQNSIFPINLMAQIPSRIISSELLQTASAKMLHIANLLVTLFFYIVPSIFMIHYSKDTFFNIAYGNRPFTKESAFNMKILGIIIASCSLFFVPIQSLILAAVAGQFNILLYANLTGLILGFLIVGLSYLVEYIQDIKDANVVLVQVLQEDVQAEIQQEKEQKLTQEETRQLVQPQPVLEKQFRNTDLLEFNDDSSNIEHVFNEF